MITNLPALARPTASIQIMFVAVASVTDLTGAALPDGTITLNTVVTGKFYLLNSTRWFI